MAAPVADVLLVIGETAVAQRVCSTLRRTTAVSRTHHLVAPGDAQLSAALDDQVTAAAILVRDDVAALRYALALAHLDPALPMVVTIFDRTIAGQLRTFLPQATVISPAALAVPSLTGPCLGPDLLAVLPQSRELVEVRHDGTTPVDLRAVRRSPRLFSRLASALRWGHRHHDTGTRLLLIGLLGLAGVLVADWIWLMLVDHHGIAESFLHAARVVATVGPGPTEAGPAYGVLSGIAMLATIVLTALFTAGLIDRFLEPRLLGLLGTRTAPRTGHVIVVGMGQVGVRLCEQLQAMHLPVVGVERDKHAPHLELARRLGIPVVIGSGSERRLLERLNLDRSLALAAVGSDDLDNIAVAVAAAAVSPDTRVMLRAGEQEAVTETRSLLPLGVTRDTTEIAAAFVAAAVLGHKVDTVVAAPETPYLRTRTGEYEPFAVARKDGCSHR